MTRLKVLAGLFAVLGLAIAVGLPAQESKSSFDVVVIKPAAPDENGRHWNRDENMTQIGNYPLLELIMRSYDLKSASQVIGAPDWATRERYDLTAKMTPEEMKRLDALPPRESFDAYRTALREMLAERFGLRVERTTRRLPRFLLERVSTTSMGPGLKVTPTGPDGRAVGGRNTSRNGGVAKVTVKVSGASMDDVADMLSGGNEVGQRVVVNHTGLPGYFNYAMEYAPDSGMGVSPEATMPGLVDSLRDQLGLKLVKDEGDVPVVVVTAASKPELD